MSNIAGLILAGGESRRIGTDKSILKFQGVSLLQRIVDEHKKVVDSVYVIGKKDKFVENVTGIPDTVKNIGPIGGLHTGMSLIDADCYLISPCDMPFLKSEDLMKLLISSEETDADAVIAKSEKGIEPLVAVYKKTILSKIEENIDSNNYAIRALFSKIKVKYLDFNEQIFEKNIFFNINYPEDYDTALKLL